MTTAGVVPACLLAAAPVVQPPHLEGDAALATEVLPGPPPLTSIQQAGLPRKDHKKSTQSLSYLPTSDPGTTYGANTVSTMAAAATEVDGPRRKRARLDKVRSQRASARNNHAATHIQEFAAPMEAVASSSHLAVESDGAAMQVDSDDAMLSRSNSVQLMEEGENGSTGRRGRDKGKGKERVAPVRVKEEPAAVSLNATDSTHGSAAVSGLIDALVASHPFCRPTWTTVHHVARLDRSYTVTGAQELSTSCVWTPQWSQQTFQQAMQGGIVQLRSQFRRQKPPPKPPTSLRFMAPLIDHVQSTIPSEYQLPEDIRTFFKNVAVGARGVYEDNSEHKKQHLNRHGQAEERDPYRLKDRNGDPVICFRCGSSALPPTVAATSPSTKRQRRATGAASTSESGRAIVSCDYCHLHWHLDCLDPPLALMPPWNRKWMCPNHADHVLQPKHRIPKANAPPIDITKPGQWNNGNIEVIQPESAVPMPPRFHVDEVLINGRRYRVPERIITMDFWNRTKKGQAMHIDRATYESGMSSPLTSLSGNSDDESEEMVVVGRPVKTFDLEELRAAMSLCGMHSGQTPKAIPGPSKGANTRQDAAPPKKMKISVHPPHKAPAEPVPVAAINGVAQPESAGVRRSSRRSRPARTYGFNEDCAELSEESREYILPEHTSRRQKRDSNGKFIRKADRSYHHHGHKASSSVAPSEAATTHASSSSPPLADTIPPSSMSTTSPEPSDTASGVVAAEPAVSAPSSRPKRNRQPARRADSPMTIISAPAQSNGNAPTRSPILNVPAPTSLHPSLRYKSTVSPPETVTKVSTPKNTTASKHAKHATPASTHKIAPISTAKDTTTTPSSGLKIRLPRISTVLPSVASSTADVDMSSAKTHNTSDVRPRRSLRRQTSVSTSMTGTSLSAPPSPKASGLT
ncbi:hypothetical protein EIP86_007725 [Pleurotus ostreatoroseus]|nr:hypothetical protein EIP86_007725 [Pleurotus ostreatoroseus]